MQSLREYGGEREKDLKIIEGCTNEWLNLRRQSEEEQREESKEWEGGLGRECGGVEGRLKKVCHERRKEGFFFARVCMCV